MDIAPLTAFDGKLWVHFGQAYVLAKDCDGRNLEEAFANQRNGLCGAAVPGSLFLITGLHTGYVKFCVQVHHAAPPLDDSWEEIVEASWRLHAGPVVLEDWDGTTMCDIPLEPGSWRVRYAARHFRAGEDDEGCEDIDNEPVEHYLLQFWPAPPADDAVRKQTSAHAAYWNDTALASMKR